MSRITTLKYRCVQAIAIFVIKQKPQIIFKVTYKLFTFKSCMYYHLTMSPQLTDVKFNCVTNNT